MKHEIRLKVCAHVHTFIVRADTYNYIEAVQAVEVQSRTINTYNNIYLEAVKGGHTYFKVCAHIKRLFLSNITGPRCKYNFV